MTSPHPLLIGGLIFETMDQADFTGPFEVLSRIPDSKFLTISPDGQPIIDAKGLILTPQMSMAAAPQIDVLLVPGGTGVNVLMEDEATLDFVRKQAANAKLVFAVCTGALVLGAAGLLTGRRATTHWATHHLLARFGAHPERDRVVVDRDLVTAAGVTSGYDGALRVAALLAGANVAQQIQLYLEYAPEPPFHSGSPDTAPREILEAVRKTLAPVIAEREQITERAARKLQS